MIVRQDKPFKKAPMKKAKKITDAERLNIGLAWIEDIAANESILRDGPVVEALDEIYRIAHTLRSPECRKNHPAWVGKIDAAIRASKGRK